MNDFSISETSKHRKTLFSAGNISLIYGLLTAGGLIAYFFVMKLLGLLQIIELRAFNFVILSTGIFLAVRNYSTLSESGKSDYFKGLGVGIRVTFYAVALFCIFLLVYLMADPQTMMNIKQASPFSEYVNPGTATGVVLVEGLSSGFVVAFSLMQYFKRNF